jgi:hypothetical protein
MAFEMRQRIGLFVVLYAVRATRGFPTAKQEEQRLPEQLQVMLQFVCHQVVSLA